MYEIQQEIVPIAHDDFFIILNHYDAVFKYPIHCHPEYEINVVMDTCGTRVIGDSQENFEGLDIVMMGPYLPHVWKAEGGGHRVVTIQFSGDLLKYQIINKRLFLPIKQLLVDSAQGLCFNGPEAERIRDEILELTMMQGFQTATKFLNILNYMATASRRRLVSNFSESEVSLITSSSRRISKACKYIEENLSKKITLSEVAELVNMSGSAFSHFFKKKTGISFITYVNNLRVARACELLIDTSLSASEICYDCGFNNLSNFNRIFKKKKNCSPKEFRENFRRNKKII